MQFVFCSQLFTEKHVHFTTTDDVMTLILFEFLYCSYYEKKKKKKNTVNVLKISTHFFLSFFFCFYKMLINAVAAQEHVVQVVPEHLYIAMMGSLRQQFYPRMRQAGRDRKIFDSHRKG